MKNHWQLLTWFGWFDDFLQRRILLFLVFPFCRLLWRKQTQWQRLENIKVIKLYCIGKWDRKYDTFWYLSMSPNCSIFRVPNILSRYNPSAYLPSAFSMIRPFHYGKPFWKPRKTVKSGEFCEASSLIFKLAQISIIRQYAY